jgi:O-antigen/teichoic acid export membrane protein
MIKKILKNDMSWTLISNGITALLGFVNLGFIAHQYAAVDAGQWFMLLTVYTLLELLRSGWVQTPFVRYYVTAQSDKVRMLLTSAAWQLLLFFTLLLAGLATPLLYILSAKNSAFVLANEYTVLWLFSALPFQLLQWQLQARKQFKQLAIARIIFAAGFTVILLVQLKFRFSIHTVVLLYALLQLLIGVMGVIAGWLKFGSWRSRTREERKLLSGFGKYSMVTMVASSLLRSSDQFIIAIWLGPAAVAVYAIPQKLIEAIEIPVRSFASVAVPNATACWEDGKLRELRGLFYRQCGFLFALILPLLLMFLVFPGPVVNMLGGNKYHQSALLLQIFCFYAAVVPIDRYCGVLLDACNRPRQNTLKVILMLIANVALDLMALWFGLGLYGVAAGSTITFLLGVVLGWIQLKDILKGFSLSLLWKEGIIKPIVSLKNTPVA